MSPSQWRAFLLDRARPAMLSTTRADGRPHLAPIWFDLDGDELVFTTAATSVKGRAIERDGRVAICVDDERPPFAYVLIEGQARIDPNPDALRRWATVIGGRYMGADRADEYGARNGVEGERLVRVPLHTVVARSGIAD